MDKAKKTWEEVLSNTKQDMSNFGITQKQLSDESGLSTDSISKILTLKIIPTCIRWIQLQQTMTNIIDRKMKLSEALKLSQNEKRR